MPKQNPQPIGWGLLFLLLLFQRKFKLQSTSIGRVGGDGTTMQQNGVLDDGEAEARAAQFATAALVDTVEALEETV